MYCHRFAWCVSDRPSVNKFGLSGNDQWTNVYAETQRRVRCVPNGREKIEKEE